MSHNNTNLKISEYVDTKPDAWKNYVHKNHFNSLKITLSYKNVTSKANQNCNICLRDQHRVNSLSKLAKGKKRQIVIESSWSRWKQRQF